MARAATAISVLPSLSSSPHGTPVTLTATMSVAPPGGGAPLHLRDLVDQAMLDLETILAEMDPASMHLTGFEQIRIKPDLAGRDRIAQAIWPGGG